jgi:hypothetical protein
MTDEEMGQSAQRKVCTAGDRPSQWSARRGAPFVVLGVLAALSLRYGPISSGLDALGRWLV